MPAISKETLEQVLLRIQEFRNLLDFSLQSDRMLDGTLYELSVHFLQRAMPYSYCYDLDFIVVGYEDKKPIPRALIEIKKEKRELSKNQRTIYLKIARALNIPAYILVFYNEDKFQIKRLDVQEDIGYFTYTELTEWFQKFTKGSIEKGVKEKEQKMPDVAILSKINLGDVIG